MTTFKSLTAAVAVVATLGATVPATAQSVNSQVDFLTTSAANNFGDAELVDANFRFKKKKFAFGKFGGVSRVGKAKKFKKGFGGFNNGFVGGRFNNGFGSSVFIGNGGFGGTTGFVTF